MYYENQKHLFLLFLESLWNLLFVSLQDDFVMISLINVSKASGKRGLPLKSRSLAFNYTFLLLGCYLSLAAEQMKVENMKQKVKVQVRMAVTFIGG